MNNSSLTTHRPKRHRFQEIISGQDTGKSSNTFPLHHTHTYTHNRSIQLILLGRDLVLFWYFSAQISIHPIKPPLDFMSSLAQPSPAQSNLLDANISVSFPCIYYHESQTLLFYPI